MATEVNIPQDESASQKTILEEGFSMTENRSSMELSTSNKSPTEYTCKSKHCQQADEIENPTFTKLSEDERQHHDVEAGCDKVEAINETDVEESTHHTEKDGAQVSRQVGAEEPMTDQYKSPEVIAETTQQGMITSQENENTRAKGEEDADLECIKQPTSTSETNMGLINEAPLLNLDLTTKGQGEEDERVEKSCAKDETRDPAIHVEDEVKELSLDGVQKKKEDMPSLMEGECKDPESIGSSDRLEHANNTDDDSTINVEEYRFDAPLKIGDNVDDKLENPYSDQVTDGVSTEVATEASETPKEVASTVCRDEIKGMSEDSRMNLEKHHEEERDSQPKNGQENQLGEQATLIPEETEIAASRENAENKGEQNILPVEEFEERGEKDEQTSTPNSGETSISTEKIPPLAELITKIKGEENMIPQKIENDLNSTDPLVGETGQPDSTGEVPKTEAREKHQESSEFCSENNEQEEHISETPSTENLVVKHMDSEPMVTTETITKLTKDTEELQKVPDSHSEDETGTEGDEKIISEESTEGEEAINRQLFATESVTEDEDPSRLSTVASARDETIEQNESHRPKDEAEESKKAAEVFDLPNTRGGQDINEQRIMEGSVAEASNNFRENENQIQNLRDDPHEEIKGENHVSHCPPEFIQKTGQEEGYSTATRLCSNPNECSSAESKSSADSSSLDKSPTENTRDSEHQILTKSENERQHQNGVEATEDKTIEEHHNDIEDDGAKISKLASIEEPNPKVHEEETSIDNKNLDQHLELITDQHATFEVILASTEKEMITSQTNENTTSKRDEDADLECSQQATSISEKSRINNEDVDNTMHVEDEFKEMISTGLQNKKAGQVGEVNWKDPKSMRSNDKSEHENIEESKLMNSTTEDASTATVAHSPYIHSIEESTFEAPSNNEDNDKENLENPASSLVADGENTQVAIEAEETMQGASSAACVDNICESVRQKIGVTPVDDIAKSEDLACPNRDIKEEHGENIIQPGLPDNNEESKINAETHDGEKRDLNHKNEQEHKVGEQAHLIQENMEVDASRENEEKRMDQNTQYFDVKEPTSAPDIRETSISTEKSLSSVESISEINSEERISPQHIANNLNTNHLLVEDTGQPDSGDIVSKTDAPEEHQESSESCVEYNKQHEHHPETQSTENLIIKQVDTIVTTETVSEAIKDVEEVNKFPLSYSEEKIDIKEDEKIIPEESKEMEEAADKQSHETAKESIFEDQAPSRLLTTTLIRDETIEQSTMEESPKDSESTLIEKDENDRAENDAKEKIKAPEPSKATGRKDIYEQQIMEGSVEGTTDKFQDNEKETEDVSTEIKGENYDTGLPSEFNQNTEMEERHSMTAQLESNPDECSIVELESSVESSSPEKSQTEKIFESEQFQADKAEAINGISIEAPDHGIEHDSAKSSMLASAQKPDPKVHEEETSIDNSNHDQHLKLLIDQHASFEVIPESVDKEMITAQTNENTRSKREEDADLECNEQVTSTHETNLGEISEASLPNLELATKSKGEEDESVIESLTKDEGIETTKLVEDESKDLGFTGIQNRKAETAFIQEGEQKDPESFGSSKKLEHENNREEDASTTNTSQIPYIHSVLESIFEAASKNGDNEEDNREKPSSTVCKDKNKDCCESAGPEEVVPPVDRIVIAEDSTYLDRDAKGANEEDINQAGLTETIEDSRINPELHEVEKRDSLQKNDQEYELGEPAVLISEKTEEEPPREKAEKRIEQNTGSVEKLEEQEKDEPTSTVDSGETLRSTEKSFPLAESTKKINIEETTFPQIIASDRNIKDPLVEDSGNFDIDETGQETQTEAQEKLEDSSKTCTENDKQDEQHSEAQSTEDLVIKHVYSEEMVTTNTIIKSTKETEELDRVSGSLSQEKIDIKGDEKIMPEEPKEMEDTAGLSENEALSKLPRTASGGKEKIEHSFQEESPNDGAAMIDKNEICVPENDAEEDKKAVEAFDLPETDGRQDINEKQVIEESLEETMKSFQDDEMKIQILREDTRREIEGEGSVSSLPSELIQAVNGLQHGKRDETILCESNETVENPEILGMSSKNEEQILFGEHGSPTPKEVSIENQDECAYSMKVDEDKAQLSRQNSGSLTYTEGEETCSQLETFSQKEKMEEEPKDTDGGKVSEPSETEVSALKPEEGEIESTAGTLSSATIGMDTRKEYMEEVECDQTKIKDEVEVTESEGQTEATYSIERKTSNPLDDFSKPKEDHDDLTIEENNTLAKGLSSILGVPNKDSSSTNDSQVELRLVNESTAMKEVKPVDDIAERQEAEANPDNSNKEVKEVVDQEEQISHDIKEKDLITGINHEIELTTNDDQLAHSITDYFMMPSCGEPKTVETSKTTENTPAREDVLFVETETPLITHTEGASMSASLDNEKGKEDSNKGIQKHNDEDHPMPPNLKAENITSESDTGGIVRDKREQADGLADPNEAHKLEIVEDEKSTIEMTKTLLQEEELSEKTEDSSAVTRVEREAAELTTATYGSQEEHVDTRSGELLMEKGDFVAKDQSEEILLHSNIFQTEVKENNLQDQDSQSAQEVPASNLEPRCNDEDLLNSSLDQDGNINAIKFTHEVYQRSGIADNNESVKEHPTEGRITSPGEETENEVEVSTSKLTEQTESTKSTEGKKPLASDNQTEQNMEMTDLSALKSSDASETNPDDPSSTPKVYEKETEPSFVKKDDSATDDPKVVSVIVEIEEAGLQNSRTGHIEYDRVSVIASENEGETAITTDKTTSDSIDIVGREEENFNSEKEEILEEQNEGNLKMDSCVTETDKTTTVQQEREQSISTISMSQDYPAPLVEEKATMANAKIHPTDAKSTREEIIDEAAETYLVHSIEIALPEKEHEAVKLAGSFDSESVNVTKECSHGDTPQLKNEVNEEKVPIEASMRTTNSTREDSETVQGQDYKDTTLEGSLTNVAIDKAETALENEHTDELPGEKSVEAANTNEKVELVSESTAEDQRDGKIHPAKEKSNCEEKVLEPRENVPNEEFEGGIQREVDMHFEIEHHTSVPRDTDATMLGGCTENVPAAAEMANGSENILEHSPEPTSNLKESDTLTTCHETITKATATNAGFVGEGGGTDLVEERISENLTKANEDFSFTTIEASEEGLHTQCEKTTKSSMEYLGVEKENKSEISNKEDDNHTSESLPCTPEWNDVTTIDKGAKTSLDPIDPYNIQEERLSDKKRREMGQETRDKAPTTGEEPSAMGYDVKKSSMTRQTVSDENQHEEKSKATEEGEYDNTKNNPPDDKDGKNVAKVATELTHENRDTERKVTGRTEVMAEDEKDQEVEPDSKQKESIDTADVSQSTREIQKLEESCLGEVDIKATVKADAETRETSEDVEQGLHKPDGETKPEVQRENAKSTNIAVESTKVEEENVSSSTEEPLRAVKHLDEAMDLAAKAQKAETPQCEEAKAESEEDEGINGNETMEPLPSGDSIRDETPKDGEAKVKHKKSHNILSGVGSKVKHSISKVKKAITGKSSHPKTSSPK